MHPTLSVLIVTWNSREELARSLPALLPELGEGDELIVVDNDSADGTPEAVAELAPAARVVRSGANLGFAAACNLGAEQAVGELLVILNPDAAPRAGWGEAIRRPWLERRGWAAWQALVAEGDGATINSAGNPVHFTGIVWAGLHGRPLAEAPRGRRGDGALRRLPGDPARQLGPTPAASPPTTSSTTRTSTSRCGCGWPAGRWESSRRRWSTTTTSSAPASTSGAGWSATAMPSCFAPTPRRC